MAQQVTKRYRLKKDLPTAKAGTIYYNDHGSYYTARTKGTQVEHDWVVEHAPDWFEEVKDDPFRVVWNEFNVKESKDDTGFRHSFYGGSIPADKIPEIEKAIEDIVNGVDEKVVATYHGRPEEKTAVGFDEHAKIYSATEVDQLQREAFEAGKNRSWCIGNEITSFYGDPTYEDYKNSKK